MCQVCREFKSGIISSYEALNLSSVTHFAGDPVHAAEIVELVMNKEVPMPETDSDMDAIYEKELKG